MRAFTKLLKTILSSSGIPFSFLEIGMKTSLASERTGGIACPTLNSLTFTRPGVEFVGQAFSLPSPPSGLFSYLRVLGKLLKLGRVESQILRKNDEDRHSGQARMPVLLNWSQNATFMRYLLGVDVGGSSDRETAGVSKRR